MPAIVVENLVKTYARGLGRVTALAGVSLTFEPGETVGIIGPNGAGKTTLLGCLLGFLRPDSGKLSIEGRAVIVIEDIVDSGLTLSYLLKSLQARRPRSLAICALLTKPERREVDVPVTYVGFEIPNRFVVGYGLDYDERFRNLQDIAVVEEARLPG